MAFERFEFWGFFFIPPKDNVIHTKINNNNKLKNKN
jgi:hypothetical protein